MVYFLYLVQWYAVEAAIALFPALARNWDLHARPRANG